ncbi:hypothetical protein [Acinetobacter haemolyticus]|uniref:Uncharacterized protein n=1 Tax=Acinetobacter haemolyticus TaxID=29430 RepID=A0AAJ2YUU1_ACIHA|nr:hypothetical protein [Acinetobacter haemolyticus]NAR36707.1 hypothetical protein [Acinetobacter haemolyticus]NAR47777.1 hypothetical protein [Acinetobacter haemolyticus]NAR73654.1 hypothetical protein [Acinetobacter haemolyticus]
MSNQWIKTSFACVIGSYLLIISAYAETSEERMMRNSKALFEGLENVRVERSKAFTQSGGDVEGASRAVNNEIKKYNIMRNNGASLVDLCLQSSMISEMFLNEGHEQGYKSWNRAAVMNCQTAKNPPRL